jgi:uncharacterized phage protein gp47/JayE
MADFPSYLDLFRIARDEMLLKNSALRREIIERAGSDANALAAAGVAIGDEIVGQLLRVNVALYMDTANGKELDRLLFDRYQLLRKPAAPARGVVQFRNPTPVVSGFSIDAGTLLNTPDNVVFAVTSQMTFPTSSSGPVNVFVQSVLAGANQQARIGTITSIQSSIPGAPGTLTVTNIQATAGADDEETDEHFRDRGKRFYTTARRGTLRAIEVGALAVPGVQTATAFEVIDFNGDAARLVQLVIADAFTRQLIDVTSPPPAYQVQSQALADAVRAGLFDVRACGIQVFVIVAVVQLLGISLALRFRAGADIQAAETEAKTVLLDYVNSLAPGAPFVYATANDRLHGVPGLVVLGGEIVNPPGDVIPRSLEVLRTELGFITIGSC